MVTYCLFDSLRFFITPAALSKTGGAQKFFIAGKDFAAAVLQIFYTFINKDTLFV